MVVVQAPHDITPIATDVDIFGPRRVDERVHRQMGFQEAAVGLRLDVGEFHLLGRHPQVEPWRHLRDLEVWIPAKHHLRDDLLHPGGSRFGVC